MVSGRDPMTGCAIRRPQPLGAMRTRRACMVGRQIPGFVITGFTLLLMCATASAQNAANGSITGVVKDASGAVLPGVTVEAASPALIEKLRTAVTDGQGLYRI